MGYLFQKWNTAYLLLGNPCKYLLWFWVGMGVDNTILTIKQHCNKQYKKICIIGSFLWFIMYIFITVFVRQHISLWRETILPFAAIMIIWLDAACLEEKINNSEKVKKTWGVVSTYCYGIYLYAEPWNYVVLWGLTKGGGISYLCTIEGTVLEFLLRSIGSAGIAIIITHVLKKNKFFIKAY